MRDIWRDARAVATADLGNGLQLTAKLAVGQDGQPVAAITKMAANGAAIGSVGFRLTQSVRQLLRQLADADVPAQPKPKAAAAAASSGAAKALEQRIERIERLLAKLAGQ